MLVILKPCGHGISSLFIAYNSLSLPIVFRLQILIKVVFICDSYQEENQRLLVAELILCNNPKANGEILLGLSRESR